MISVGHSIHSISKIASAVAGLFENQNQYKKALDQVENLQNFLDKEEEVYKFLVDYSVAKEVKQELINEISKGDLDEYLANSFRFLIDNQLIFHIKLFLSSLKSRLQEFLKVKNVFIYSSFEISSVQKRKLESLWSNRVKSYKCHFVYLIDKSLKLGIKVQVDDYVEEFSVKSNLLNLELKLDSVFI